MNWKSFEQQIFVFVDSIHLLSAATPAKNHYGRGTKKSTIKGMTHGAELQNERRVNDVGSTDGCDEVHELESATQNKLCER